jgi:hypothetical protein
LRRRSDTSSRWPPDDLVFFVDRSLEKRHVAEALRREGIHVEVHEDHFLPGAPDVEWLPVVGRRGWIVLMKDKQIRRNTLERDALLAADVRAFVLTAGNLTGPEMAAAFVRHLRRIVQTIHDRPPPFIAAVTRTGVHVY